MAQIRQQYLASNPQTNVSQMHAVGTLGSNAENISKELTPGSLQWCAAQLNGPLNAGGSLAKYRFLTGDTQYDHLLEADANGYVKYRLTGNQQALTEAMKQTADSFRSNREAYTSEVRFTDRVFRFPLAYLSHYMDRKPASPDFPMLYGSITGDPGDALYFPMNAVKWMTEPRELAVLVSRADPHHFEAQLYHFGSTPRALDAMLYQLKPGQYNMTVTAVGASVPLASTVVNVSSPQTPIQLTLPPQTLCIVNID